MVSMVLDTSPPRRHLSGGIRASYNLRLASEPMAGQTRCQDVSRSTTIPLFLVVSTNWANEITCSMADLKDWGQPRGSGILGGFCYFAMLPPGIAEGQHNSSKRKALGAIWRSAKIGGPAHPSILGARSPAFGRNRVFGQHEQTGVVQKSLDQHTRWNNGPSRHTWTTIPPLD